MYGDVRRCEEMKYLLVPSRPARRECAVDDSHEHTPLRIQRGVALDGRIVPGSVGSREGPVEEGRRGGFEDPKRGERLRRGRVPRNVRRVEVAVSNAAGRALGGGGGDGLCGPRSPRLGQLTEDDLARDLHPAATDSPAARPEVDDLTQRAPRGVVFEGRAAQLDRAPAACVGVFDGEERVAATWHTTKGEEGWRVVCQGK